MKPHRELTIEQRERIVDLRLNRVSIRSIAAEIECSTTTVQTTFRRWLEATAKDRAEHFETGRTEALARLDRIATDARLGAVKARQAGNHAAAARYLAVEVRTLISAAQLEGIVAPIAIEHSGVVEHDHRNVGDDALAVVDELAARRRTA